MTNELETGIRELGRQLLEWRSAGLTAYRTEGTQFKAEADQRAHDALVTCLHRTSPGTPIVSEEDAASLAGDPAFPYWLVDPIDGTASYVQGFAGFVVQLALMDVAGPLEAYVYAPATDEMFTAARGGGAWLNGRRLRLESTAPRVLTDNYPEPRGVAADAMAALGLTEYVESGSIGLKICRVAEGRADLFVKDVLVRDWDVAPGELIVAEAGGRLSTLEGASFSWGGERRHIGLAVSSSAELHRRVVAWGSTLRR